MIQLLQALAAGAMQLPPCTAPVTAPRLDHVIIAVRNLDSAAARFARLGFTLKPGRPHANGLLNQHVKFRDGTELELMTVSGPATDRMAREYAALIVAGDGGAYLALRMPTLDSARASATRLGLGPRESSSGSWHYLSFAPSSTSSGIFFIAGGATAVDRDSILAHRDGAQGLAEVWLEAGPALPALLRQLGARPCADSLQVAGRWGQRIAVANGTIVLLPIAYLNGPPRVIGVVLRTSSASARQRPPEAVLPNFWLAYGIE